MIASLRGTIQQKRVDRIVVDVRGVGYELFLSLTSLERMPPTGEEVFLHVHTSVREDAITLYGFHGPEEKEMFLLLLNVTGVGPRLALAVLSGISPPALARAVAEHDIKLLTGLSGVGRKTAERICLDLKDKVGGVVPEAAADTTKRGVSGAGEDQTAVDVVSALTNLGYPQARAQSALTAVRKRLPPETFNKMRIEELIRETLRSLA